MATPVAQLAALPIFADASPEALADLAAIVEKRRMEFGTVLIHQGEPHTVAYVITEGTVSVVTDGHDYPSIGAGGIVGELAMFIGCESAPATITAMTDTTALTIDHDAFNRVISRHQNLWRTIAVAFAGRLHALDTEHTQWNRAQQGALR